MQNTPLCNELLIPNTHKAVPSNIAFVTWNKHGRVPSVECIGDQTGWFLLCAIKVVLKPKHYNTLIQYTSDAWSQKIACRGRFWYFASDAWFWNVASEYYSITWIRKARKCWNMPSMTCITYPDPHSPKVLTRHPRMSCWTIILHSLGPAVYTFQVELFFGISMFVHHETVYCAWITTIY